MESNKSLPYWIIGVFALFSLVFYIFRPGGDMSLNILTNIIAIGAAVIAFAGGVTLSRRHDFPGRRGWQLLTLGLGFFSLAS